MKKLLILAATATLFAVSSCKKEETATPTPVTYSKVYLNKIEVNAIPFVDANNNTWDLSNGPDCYVVLAESTTGDEASFKDYKIDDVQSQQLPIWWSLTTPGQLDFAATYMVTVYDADSPDADDNIGFNTFTLSDLGTKGYPAKITSTRWGVTTTLYLTYGN